MAQLALLGVALTVAVTSGSIVQSPLNGKDFELLILHNNDMHARFEQTSQLSGACTTADREAGKCYGGFPRVAHVVKEARKAAATGQGPPVLYLNAGDTYTGTAWFTIYKWKIAAEFVNALQPDAVSLGNNEFENGAEELSPFLSNIDTKILAANVILKSAEGNNKFQKSAIFDLQGVKVGVVGFLTPEAKNLDESDNVEYINEVIALKEEVNKLQEQNINIIIALGHSTAEKTVEIAQEVDGIDLVISGHKNTFFWNGSTVYDEDEVLTVTQNSGKRVPIIQSAAYDKFLGKLVATFSTDGEITNYNVEHVILDESIPQNQEALKMSTKSNDEVTLRANTPIGNTAVVLDGGSCKTEECNLGNLIADAMVYNYALSYEGETWTDTAIAFIHADAIAASIAPPNRPATVTYGDLWRALPLESNVVIVTMNGTILNNVLEHSVFNYNLTTPSTQFLQFSGIRVVYDMSQPPGSRVVSAVVRCWSCYVPEFYIIDDWRTYNVLMPVALAEGQFGYSMLAGLTVQSTLLDEVTSTAKFIAMRSPVYPEVAGRIVLRNVAPVEEEEEEDTGEIEETTTEAVVTEEVTTDAPDSATRLTCTLLFVVLLSFILS